MNRRQLAFLVLVNAMVSLVIALAVVWVFEARRPDPEELAAINTPRPSAVLAAPAATPTPDSSVAATVTTNTVAPAPAESEPTPTPTQAPEEIYVVQPGDTLLSIATRYSLTVDDLLSANNLTNPDYVFAGQRLVIPLLGGATAPPSGGTEPAGEPVVQGVQIAAVTNPGDLTSEPILVVNESDTAFSLQGWQLQRSDGPAFTFTSDTPLFPGGSVRVHTRSGESSSIDFYWGLSEPAWPSGATAQLINDQGTVVHSYTVP
jgi:LysM repeat protein